MNPVTSPCPAATSVRHRWLARAGAVALACTMLALPIAPVSANDKEASHSAALLKLISKSRLIDLSHTWDSQSPIASVNPHYAFNLAATHAGTRGAFGDNGQLSFTSETMQWSGQHGAPSIDALGHIGRDGKLYGGVDAAASTSNPAGLGASGAGAHLAIDKFPNDLLINRGVLLDVARLIQGDASPLPATFEITAQHLMDAERAHGVRVRKGDTVFIRTGWGAYFATQSALYAGEASPGPGMSAADFLIARGARIVGNDTLTFEQRPPVAVVDGKFQVFPVHMRLIPDHGVFIIENLNLEELSAARAYEFAVVTPPLKVRGGTGSALRAFALVPKKD